MLTNNPAPADHDIHPLLLNRWSSRAVCSDPIDEDMVQQLLEAARWAPSSYNEQPWFYLVGHHGTERHEQLSACLLDGNAWAREAGVLILSIAKRHFDHNDKANRHYLHDVGAANNQLVLQATELGLNTHQMGGFDMDKARELFEIGDEYEPAVVIMVSHPGDTEALPDKLKEREEAPRSRKAFKDLLWTP